MTKRVDIGTAARSFLGAQAITKNDDDNGNTIDGTPDDDTLNGNGGDDTLNGLGGNDKLNGGTGNDVLNGGTGNDTMTGGAGNDVYVVDSVGDKVVETAVGLGDGFRDRVESDVTFSLASLANVEDLTLKGATGFEALNATGNAAVNTLEGNSADNILDGGKGVDTFAGHLGNDTYILDDAKEADSAHVQELGDEGIDTVKTAVADIKTAIDNVENYTFTGSVAWNFTGNALDNVIIGGAKNDTLDGGEGNDVLDGGKGVDTLTGGIGDDTFLLDNVADKIIENVDEGLDRVIAGFNIDLNTGVFAGQELENITLVGSAISATGNEFYNTIFGNDADNLLDGQGGDDHLVGGKGSDTYIFSKDSFEQVFELRGEGVDTIKTANDIDLQTDVLFSPQEIENVTAIAGNGDRIFVGNALNNVLTGADGNDTLQGGAGTDTLVGGAGNDQYVIFDADDKVVESVKSAAPGQDDADTVLSDISFSLANLANVENIVLRGENHDVNDFDPLNATGNALANHLTGNAGDNILDGGAGIDFFDGGGGNDILIIDSIDELANINAYGTETIQTGLLLNETNGGELANYTYTGKSNWIFDYSASSADHRMIGSTGTDQISTGSGNDFLDGGKGADTLVGGDGDDTYVVDNVGDKITDGGGQADTLVINRSVDLRDGKGIDAQFVGVFENVTLSGTAAINIYGSDDWGNHLIGNAGANILDGRGEADLMEGGKGNDTYFFDNQSDTAVEIENEGIDTIYLSEGILGDPVGIVLDEDGLHEIENIVADGPMSFFSVIANRLNNAINGTSSDENEFFGMEGDDVLTGGSGDDKLYGGIGADFMTGGKGNDLYEVDSAGDKVVETVSSAAGGGDGDKVESWISFSLAGLANVENLTLVGVDNTTGIGNAGANILTGGDGDNILNGGAGIDTFEGSFGNDTFILDHVEELGLVTDGQGFDTIKASFLLTIDDVVADVENYGYTGSANWEFDISTLGSDRILTGGSGSDKLTGGSTLDGGAGADQLFGGDGSTVYVIDNVGDKITETGPGSDEDKIVINRSVDLSDNTGLNARFFGAIEDVQLTGNAALSVTGDERSNVLFGNAGANVLDGNGGGDWMSGGAGNDVYIIDALSVDFVEEFKGGGIDTVKAGVDFDLNNFDPSTDGEIENLVALSPTTGVVFGGNTLNNTLVGGDFDDTLDGSVGDDILIGGKGNDLYVVSSLGDKVVENLSGAAGGTDTVHSWISYSIAGLANVENLVLGNPAVDTLALNGTGNAGANTLTGNDGDNILDGGKGIDTFDGAMGNDTYVIDNIAELGKISDSDGSDTIQTSLALTTSNIVFDINTGLSIENYVNTGSTKWVLDYSQITDFGDGHKLVGGTASDVLTGASGTDYLDGGKGNDTLTGGEGDDTYGVDSLGDVVNETGTTEGDAVVINRSVNLLTDFSGTIEYAALTGSAALDATGSFTQNTLTGNDGANKISGLAGFDILSGGKGDDILSGGADQDTFVYNALTDRGTGKEVITDFSLGDGDVLDLSKLLETFTYGSGGNDAFNAGALQFVNDGKGNTIVEVDVDGGADDFVTLVTLIGATLTEGDGGNYILQ